MLLQIDSFAWLSGKDTMRSSIVGSLRTILPSAITIWPLKKKMMTLSIRRIYRRNLPTIISITPEPRSRPQWSPMPNSSKTKIMKRRKRKITLILARKLRSTPFFLYKKLSKRVLRKCMISNWGKRTTRDKMSGDHLRNTS